MSADIIQFPERKFTPPPKGYCSECQAEMAWPSHYDWPKACPACGSTPFVITSWPPNPPSSWDTWSPNLTN